MRDELVLLHNGLTEAPRSACGSRLLGRWPTTVTRTLMITVFLAGASVVAAAPPAVAVDSGAEAGFPAEGEPALGADLTLAAAVETAVRDNAELKSMRAKWGAMLERPAQAVALPDPMFEYSGMDMASGGDWPNTNEKRFMLQQEFPWFGKRSLRKGIAQKDAEAMRRELDAMTRDVVMMVKETYSDLYAVQRVISITGDEQDVLRHMAQVAQTMYATGQRPQADVIKAQAEITMLKQKLLDVQAQEVTLKAKLNTLMNRRANAPLGTAVAPPETKFPADPDTLFALAANNRPEIQAAQAQVERYELEKRLMAKEYLPDYRLGVEYRDIGNSDDMVMFSVSFDLPIWLSKYRAGVREAELMRESSKAARETAERESANDVQDASFKLLTARQTLSLYKTELIPRAEARFSASEAGYRTGQADFMDLLESERFRLDVRIMAAMAEGVVGMNSARLERALGIAMPSGGNAGGEGQ